MYKRFGVRGRGLAGQEGIKIDGRMMGFVEGSGNKN